MSIPESVFLVGHVGRFNVQKDYPTLLEACAKLRDGRRDFRLLLCGKALVPSNQSINDLIEMHNLGSLVVLLGERDDVPTLLQSFDVFVLSSLGEGFPNVVVEAMATSVPCVVTDVGDAAEIVGGTGWVVPPRDPQALALAMLAALEELPIDRRHRGRAARTRVEENYAIKKMVTAYQQVWNTVLAERTD
jgi:glycosyltransferase involved in cell wall biosynthesis